MLTWKNILKLTQHFLLPQKLSFYWLQSEIHQLIPTLLWTHPIPQPLSFPSETSRRKIEMQREHCRSFISNHGIKQNLKDKQSLNWLHSPSFTGAVSLISPPISHKAILLFLCNEYACRTMNFCTGEELKINQSHAIRPQTLQVISHSPALLINESNYPTIRAFSLFVFGTDHNRKSSGKLEV